LGGAAAFLDASGTSVLAGGFGVAPSLREVGDLGVWGWLAARWMIISRYESRSATVSPTMFENSACTSNRSWGASHASEIRTAVSASVIGGHERIATLGLKHGEWTEAAGDRAGRTGTGCRAEAVVRSGGRHANRSGGCRRTDRRA
jgi:hypothetical protein